jgi:DNA-binding transcriptional regulator YhcF (GntR family)
VTKTLNFETAEEPGAWLPWPIAEQVCRLRLRPSSRWKVFLVVLFTWCRYGRREAWLTIPQIAQAAGVSERTVKAALKDLVASGVINRIGRTGKFTVNFAPVAAADPAHQTSHQQHHKTAESEGEDKLALAKGSDACPSSNSTYCSSINKKGRGLTVRQQAAIRKTVKEATDLLGEDAGSLPLPEQVAQSLGLDPKVTYGEAFTKLQTSCDARTAHAFTKAVLHLRDDERIQGTELLGESADNQTD